MDIEKIKTAVDNINEEYLLDAAEYISGKDMHMKNENNVNANDLTIVEGSEKKGMGKVTKWLSVAAVFCFIVAGVAVIGITSGNNQLGSQGITPLDSKVEESVPETSATENSQITSVEESSVVEKTEEELLWEKAVNETSASGKTHYDGTYSIEGQVVPADSYRYVEYKGGKITIDVNILAEFGEIAPEEASVGYYVTINGVVQDLYVGEESIGKTYIHRNNKEEIESGNAKGEFSLSFTPTIAQSDKDMKEFNLCLVSIISPDYRVSPYYVSCGLNHINHTTALWKLHTNNVAIENYVDEAEVEAVNYEKKIINDPTGNIGSHLYDKNGGEYEIRCDGDSVSVKTQLRVGESEGNKYRIVYLVNGVPVTLSDGRTYLEVDAEPCTQYDFDVVTINGIQPYDTIDVIEFICDDDVMTSIMYSSTFMHKTIVPEDYVRRVG